MKKIIVLCVVIFMAVGWIIRFQHVNENVYYPKIEVYKFKDVVPIGKDYFESEMEDMNGYTISVKSAKILTATEFLKEYGKSEDYFVYENDYFSVDYVYSVKVNIKNEYNSFVGEKGIDFSQYKLQGNDYYLQVQEEMYELANQKMNGSLRIALEKNTEFEVELPFGIIPNVNNLHSIKSCEPKLLISQYPTKKMIELS